MKKLILVLALVAAMMITAPAFALVLEGAKGESVMLGGNLWFDAGYWSRSKELMTTAESDNRLYLNVNRLTQLNVLYKAGNTQLFLQQRFGKSEAVGVTTEAAKFFGTYTTGNCSFKFGRDDGSWYIFTPAQRFGLETVQTQNGAGHLGLLGWGYVYDMRLVQARGTFNVGKGQEVRVSLVEPPKSALAFGGTNVEYNQLPRLDATYYGNFGNFKIQPLVSWSQSKVSWSSGTKPSTADDSVTYFLYGLNGGISAGAFGLDAGVFYGQNIGSWDAFQTAYAKPKLTSAYQVKNATTTSAWVNLSYKAGDLTPNFYFGWSKSENDYYTATKDNTRTAYGANLWWKVSPNFTIMPEVTYYDYWKTPVVSGSQTELGTELLYGVQFVFGF